MSLARLDWNSSKGYTGQLCGSHDAKQVSRARRAIAIEILCVDVSNFTPIVDRLIIELASPVR